ncbi:MAG: hypothetical protein DMG07_01280 [Acidobacteria bacterium]|nr:MAG: hypothetical protein DMG07_01280 [Acidobacteriota bacterium]
MKEFALALILALTIPAAVAAGKTYKFDLDLEGVVGGKTLRSATYRVEVKCGDDRKGTVSFYDGYRLVVQVPCHMVENGEGSETYAVSYAVTERGRRWFRPSTLRGRRRSSSSPPATEAAATSGAGDLPG